MTLAASDRATTTRLELRDIRSAHERIAGKIHRTPLAVSSTLDALSGRSLFLKCENLQKTGAFKARGAANAILSLTDSEAARGIVTHSSGNHGAAAAWAARMRGIRAHIVMPHSAPEAKIASVRRYGGEITFCETAAEIREREAERIRVATGATLIHPFEDQRVMAGQGTIAIELLEDVPDLDLIVCPVGGGGLLSGIAVAAKALKPEIRIIGVEPAPAADAARSLRTGGIVPYDGTWTIADGLRTSLGEMTFAEIRACVDEIVTVPEKDIVPAMRMLWEVTKLIVEPSGAVAYAAMMRSGAGIASGKAAVILSGGNLSLDALPWRADSG